MSAYVDGLKMLGRRELSEAQVRQRLARRGHEETEIDDAIVRLKNERAIDDQRVAEAIARTGAATRRRGKLRVTRQIESAGIAGPVARRAVDEVFGSLDQEALLEASLSKRLRAGDAIENDREFGRLYAYLMRQGFDAERILRLLRARSVK